MIEEETVGVDIVILNLFAPRQSTSLKVERSSIGETLEGGVAERVGE